MATAKADSGNLNPDFGDLRADSVTTPTGTITALTATTLTGGIGGGTFVATAAGTTTITDASVASTSQIVVIPGDAAAGLLLRSKTCYVVTGSGAFTFVVSATGAGAPAGTETFRYLFLRES